MKVRNKNIQHFNTLRIVINTQNNVKTLKYANMQNTISFISIDKNDINMGHFSSNVQ